MKALEVGIYNIGDKKICILVYADDIVLLALSETELQLCFVHTWYVNSTKSNTVHFRPQSVPRTDIVFFCGDKQHDIVDKYKYLGIVLNEH